MRPFFGIQPAILDEQGSEIIGEGSGTLVMKGSWPSIMRDLWGEHNRYLDIYFKPYPGYYLTGDGAEYDESGNIRVTGRIDDAMNISGHLIGTAEIESALILHSSVAEAAVVGIPHERKGESIIAFVILKIGTEETDLLIEEMIGFVTKQVGSFAKPDRIEVVPALPKTRSGKIMRRLLRKIAIGETDTLGDISTLADSGVIDAIMNSRKNHVTR